jgi:predicted permease
MLLDDFAFAARTLRRSPVVTLAAATTIAVGIGASTAIFSVTNAVLLRPLPYTDPERLVVMYMDLRARNSLGMPLSNENFVDIRDGSRGSFDDMAAVRTTRQVMAAADGRPEQIRVAVVTVNFFRLMGASIARGRDFDDADGRPQPQAPVQAGAAPSPQGPPPLPVVAVVSHDYWQRRYGGAPDVIGQRLPGGPRAEIVGILSPGFELHFPPGANVEQKPDIWIANRVGYDNANRNTYGLHAVGRLKPGATLARAQQEVDTVAAKIRSDFPVANGAGFYARLEPMHKTLVDQVRPAILALMGGVIFLLLIACANVANLLLVRASLRGPELAMRAALGAGRVRVCAHLLAEALLLTAIGTVGGIALAWIGMRELLAIAPANLPRVDSIRIDLVVLAFTTAIALAAAFIFGMVPAVNALRMDLRTALSGGRNWGLGAGRRFRNAVVVVEVALCFVLLVGSGLMVRSFLALQRIDPGFDPRGLLTFQLLGGREGPPAERAAISRQLEDRLRAIPAVEGVTASFPFPLAGDFSTIRWGLEDALADTSKFQAVDWQVVRPGYFETLRTPLLAGRTFTDADSNPTRNLVVVDDVLAAKAFPSEPAVGKRILIRIRTPEPEWVEIIGIVGHQRVTSLADSGREQVYFAEGFVGFNAQKWGIRTTGDAASIVGAVRAAVAEVAPQFVLTDLQPMDALIWRAQAGTRFSLTLIGAFAAMAAVLVSVGLYGVLATVVRQRTAEIGVRMALGASPNRILRLVVGHGLRLSGAGILLGMVAAVTLTRAMRTMLVGVGPNDPATFAAMGAVFLVIATVSSWLPARRAAAMDPTAALRE